tara:strand:+ start:163932 stop:164225 length:294 start_codon:yes stop_codon:yes gene_type:complete
MIRLAGDSTSLNTNLKTAASERAEEMQLSIQPCELIFGGKWTGPCVSFHTKRQDQDGLESESKDIQNSSSPHDKATVVPLACCCFSNFAVPEEFVAS